MDFFYSQLDGHLSKKLEDACNNFNNYVRIQLAGFQSARLKKPEIAVLLYIVGNRIQSQHKLACNIFRDSPNCFVVRECLRGFMNIVTNIEARNMREVQNLIAYKMMLVHEKLQSENLEDVDKPTLLEWVSHD